MSILGDYDDLVASRSHKLALPDHESSRYGFGSLPSSRITSPVGKHHSGRMPLVPANPGTTPSGRDARVRGSSAGLDGYRSPGRVDSFDKYDRLASQILDRAHARGSYGN